MLASEADVRVPERELVHSSYMLYKDQALNVLDVTGFV